MTRTPTPNPRRRKPAPASAPTTPDPVEMAMAAEVKDTSANSPARQVLLEQVRLARAQRRNEEFGSALKALTGLAGLALAATLGVMAWQASQSASLVIEAFSVPPDLAQRGLTGEVVSSRFLDRMAQIQARTDSQRAPNSFTRAWDGGIEVQIPQTGITLSELRRELRASLGHDTHVSGEVARTAEGLSLTVRPDANGGVTFIGSEAELDTLIQRGAEAAFERTQPYRYAAYLRGQGRLSEAAEIYRRLAQSGPASERAWGEVGLGNIAREMVGARAGLTHFRAAERLKPTQISPPRNIGLAEFEIGHPELARAAMLRAARNANLRGEVRREILAANAARVQGQLRLIEGDYAAAITQWETVVEAGPQGANQNMLARLVGAHLGAHDLAGARAALARPDPSRGIATGNRAMDTLVMNARISVASEDWAGTIAEGAKAAGVRAAAPGVLEQQLSQLDPVVAWAMARSGDMAGAQALIATTPLDSYDAVIMRGRIAELAGARRTADHWFGQAVRMAPSVPFAHQAWAEAKLARGDLAGALGAARAAEKIAPRFADPRETQGEALLVQGDAKAAAKKFAQAAKLAPRWGRLHLKWGEALAKLGRADEAGAKWRAAATMDLSAADRAALKAHGI